MRTALFLSMFLCNAAAFLIKIRDLRRKPDSPFLRAVCTVIALAALNALAGIPVVLTFMETSTGVPAIWLLGSIVATCAALQATVLLWAYPPHEARRRIRIRVAICGATIVIMAALAYRSRSHVTASVITQNQREPEALWAATPHLRDVLLVYFAMLIFTFADAGRHFARNAGLVDRHWLRRGLLTEATACATFLSYCSTMIVYVLALRIGVTLEALPDVAVALAAISTAVVATGVVIPVLGPRWDRLLAYRRLQPLWLALRRAAPDVVLEPPWSTRVDAWSPRNLDFRLYRRVIEIRDGALAVRPYGDPDVAATVRRLAPPGQLSEPDMETTIDAARLALAIQARMAGHSPHDRRTQVPAAESGNDLDAELRSLVPIARAFAESAVVKAVLADRRRTDASTTPVPQ